MPSYLRCEKPLLFGRVVDVVAVEVLVSWPFENWGKTWKETCVVVELPSLLLPRPHAYRLPVVLWHNPPSYVAGPKEAA